MRRRKALPPSRRTAVQSRIKRYIRILFLVTGGVSDSMGGLFF